MFNGRVVDCKGAVEDTVKVFGPSLQDLFLLRNQGCSIRSKDVGRPGGLRSVRKQSQCFSVLSHSLAWGPSALGAFSLAEYGGRVWRL